MHILRIEKREMYERIEGYRGREGWWLWRGRRPAGRWVDSEGGRAEGGTLRVDGTSIPEGEIIYSARKIFERQKKDGERMSVERLFAKSLVIKKDEYGHKVFVDGAEMKSVRKVLVSMEPDEVPSVTLVLNAPNIELECDNEVYCQ